MVHSYENHTLPQKNVDIIFLLWYAEYVGAALGLPVFSAFPVQKEMTLDCCSFRTLSQSRVISVHSYYLTSLVTSLS